MTRRELLTYLPRIYRGFAEFQGICAGEQPAMEAAWEAAEQLLADQFIATAGSEALARWEGMLDITPAAADTLQTRRARILAALQRQGPYTLAWLRDWLAAQCPGATAAVTDYTLTADFPDAPEGTDFDALDAQILDILPLNLVYAQSRSTSLAAELEAAPAACSTLMITLLPAWDEA